MEVSLPTKRHAVLGLNFSISPFGTRSLAAAVTSAPYPSLRPLGVCTTSWFWAVHSDSGTLQSAAAALTSIARAEAPACRNAS